MSSVTFDVCITMAYIFRAQRCGLRRFSMYKETFHTQVTSSQQLGITDCDMVKFAIMCTEAEMYSIFRNIKPIFILEKNRTIVANKFNAVILNIKINHTFNTLPCIVVDWSQSTIIFKCLHWAWQSWNDVIAPVPFKHPWLILVNNRLLLTEII